MYFAKLLTPTATRVVNSYVFGKQSYLMGLSFKIYTYIFFSQL